MVRMCWYYQCPPSHVAVTRPKQSLDEGKRNVRPQGDDSGATHDSRADLVLARLRCLQTVYSSSERWEPQSAEDYNSGCRQHNSKRDISDVNSGRRAEGNFAVRNLVAVWLVISVGVLGLLAYSQTSALREQRRQVQELTGKLTSTSKAATLDLQEKCAKQASEEFKSYWEDREGADFTDHYNAKLNKCFMRIQWFDTIAGVTIERALFDAFEGKEYGSYSWKPVKNKRPWEVPPFACTVTLPSGEERICHSSDEFEALLKQYME